MTAGSLAFEAFLSGQCPAVPGANRRGRRQAPRVQDYCLYDEERGLLGTVHGPRNRPELGRNAPTLLLDRA
jgi:hypothetical protein